MAARPGALGRIPPSAVRRDEHERALVRDEHERALARDHDDAVPRRHDRLVAFRSSRVYTRPMRRWLVALSLAAACAHPPAAAPTGRTHVYLVIVDGLDARAATAARMPRLFGLLASECERSTFLGASAVMPARTNPNHVTLITGVHAAAHGITGNAYWSRRPAAPPEKLDAAAL